VSWPLVKLGDVCQFVRGPFGGSLKKESFVESGYAVYEQQHAIYNQFEQIRYFIDESKFHELRRFELSPGDLIMSCSGTMGKIAIVPDEIKKGVINQALLKLRPSSEVNIYYLKYWLASESFQFILNGHTNGAAIKNVASVAVLKALEIPLPPLAEQKRIAAILDKADAIRRKRQQSIQLADEFLRAVYLDMFGDSKASDWKLTTVENMAISEKGSMRTGPFGSDLKHSEFVEKGISVLGIDNAVQNKFSWGKERFIFPEKYEQLKRYTVKPGDVLITIMGTCGRCAVVPDDIPIAINTKHLCCITLDRGKCLPSFLHAYFLMHPIAKQYLCQTAKGAIMNGLNMGIIKDMPIPKVPIENQREYEVICNKVSKLVESQSVGTESVNECFSSLSQKAFKGEL